MDERRWNARGELVTESEATITVEVGGEQLMTVATGNGPVNALDHALRKALLRGLSDARRTCGWSTTRSASSRRMPAPARSRA